MLRSRPRVRALRGPRTGSGGVSKHARRLCSPRYRAALAALGLRAACLRNVPEATSLPDGAVDEQRALCFHALGFGVVQVGLLQARAAEVRVAQVGAGKIGLEEIGLPGGHARQLGIPQASFDKARTVEDGGGEVASAEVRA